VGTIQFPVNFASMHDRIKYPPVILMGIYSIALPCWGKIAKKGLTEAMLMAKYYSWVFNSI